MNIDDTIIVHNILSKAGYANQIDNGSVVVSDPIQCSSGGNLKWVEYREVRITGFVQALRFIEARS